MLWKSVVSEKSAVGIFYVWVSISVVEQKDKVYVVSVIVINNTIIIIITMTIIMIVMIDSYMTYPENS